MIWLLWKLVTLPFRVVFGTIGLSFKTVRFVGLSRILAFGAGVGAGMLAAPTSGERLRARLSDQYGTGAAPDPTHDLAERVRHELAHSPRTWHLPQPVVTVAGDRVALTGTVPHDAARSDLGRTAGSVLGVAAIENHLTIDDVGDRA